MSGFDLLAKDYDIERRIKRAKMFSDELRLYITEGHNKTALEYGCGTGLVGFNLIQDFQSIVFVDSSVQMIEQVKQKLLNLGSATSYAICCDFIKDAPKDLEVDYIIISLALHHIYDTKTILTRFYNILNDAGHLLIIDKNLSDGILQVANLDSEEIYDGFDQTALAGITKEVGFLNVKTKTFNYDTGSNGVFILDATK